MNFAPAAFLRTTVPLDFSRLEEFDSGRYHSLWLPDHMVSFWPDALWTPEFTDLATVSHSPHRHLDGLAVAAAVAPLTRNVPIVSLVVDTVRRHPASLAQTALTLDHLSRGRFVLGLGAGEAENIVPYGFDFRRPVSRLEESLRVIRLLWESEGPVDFDGEFYTLRHARLDTEPYEDRFPPIWLGASGPRMLEIAGRYADGWIPANQPTPEGYREKLETVRRAAERAGRDPAAIVPCMIRPALIGDESQLAEILEAPLVKAYLLQLTSEDLRAQGLDHPMGPNWRGIHQMHEMSRDRILDFLAKVDPQLLLAMMPHGTPKEVARAWKDYVDAGARVVQVMDYGAMAGLEFSARAADNTRQVEDELVRLVAADA